MSIQLCHVLVDMTWYNKEDGGYTQYWYTEVQKIAQVQERRLLAAGDSFNRVIIWSLLTASVDRVLQVECYGKLGEAGIDQVQLSNHRWLYLMSRMAQVTSSNVGLIRLAHAGEISARRAILGI